MSNVKITVQIKITPTDEKATALSQSTKDGTFSIIIPQIIETLNEMTNFTN